MKKIKTMWMQWMEDEKSKRIVVVTLGVMALLLLIGLCVLFYYLGVHRGESEKEKSALQKTEQQTDSKEKEDGKTVSGDAVSSDAVSAEGVTAETTASGAGLSEAGTSGQNQTGSSTNPNKGSGTSNSAQKLPGNSTAGNGAGSTAVSGYAGKLSVSGNQLMANGAAIQLRGVSTHGLSWFPEYVNSALFGELKSWGANTIRLAMYTAEYNGYCTGDEQNRTKLKELVKKGVQCATEQDMYVIIDWHILSDGNPNTYKNEAIAFFSEMAQTYKDNNHVIYEICNEPNGGTSWSQIKSYANEVIAAIRQYDSDAVILVGTPTWSQEVDKAAADPITGYQNVMYTLHFYANTHRESLRKTLATAVEAGLPVFVSEFSICDASGNGGINTEQANLWIRTLNQYGISYVAWSLSNKAETSALIQSSCAKTSGIGEGDLSECGKWLLKTFQGTASSGGSAGGFMQNGDLSGQNIQDNQNASQNNTTSNSANQDNGAGSSSGEQQTVRTPEQYAPQCGDGVQISVTNSWEEGTAFCIQYDVKVANTTALQKDGWQGTMAFPVNATVVSGWNANFTASGNTVTFTNMDYNKTIQPGGVAEGIGVIVRLE